MSRKHNTKHPNRGRSAYSRRHKSLTADRYGEYREGVQKSPDRIAGTVSIKR